MKKLLFLFTLSSTSFLFSQTITGTITDGDFNEPLAFATVIVKGTSLGTTSDFDGKYQLDVEEAGTYTLQFSFLGYDTKEVSEIDVKFGDASEVNVILTGSVNQLSEVVVVTSKSNNTETAVLNLQKKSVTLMDGLSVQSIKKVGDSDLAGAIKRVPGVSVQGGKYVFVRGLGDRYSKTVLNGLEVPGLDPDRNTLQLDVFPTNLIENILVSKSSSADQPADFTGGLVDIVTKDFSVQPQYSLSFSSDFNPSMHLNPNYIKGHESTTDWMGFDNGSRNLPIDPFTSIPNPIKRIPSSAVLPGITQEFSNNMGILKGTSGLNYNFGATASNQYRITEEKSLGYIASVSLKNTTEFYDHFSNGSSIIENDHLSPYFTREGKMGVKNALISGLAGIAFKTKQSKYKLNFLFLQNGESTAIAANYQDYIENPYLGYAEVQTYTQRNITSIPLTGVFVSKDASFKIDWKVAYTKANVQDKDFRSTVFATDETNSYYVLSSAYTNWPTRIWRNLEETVFNGRMDLSKEFNKGDVKQTLKFGVNFTNKHRDFGSNIYEFGFKGESAILGGDANLILDPSNIWTPETNSGTYVSGSFQETGQYQSKSQNGSGYISDEIAFSEKFKAVLGVRFESFILNYTGKNISGAVYNNAEFINVKDFFPTANLIYSLNENQNLRISYAKKTARPSFKESSAITLYDPITARFSIGNPELKPAYIDNFDMRFENYGSNGNFFAISTFYKKFTNPIEIAPYNLNTPDQLIGRNNKDAHLIGAEFELRKNLIDTEKVNLSFSTNVSVIDAQQQMTDYEYQGRVLLANGRNVSKTRNLQGQSPYMINTGISYNSKEYHLEGGFYYNVQGKTLEVVGIGYIPDVYTDPFNSLKASFSKSFGEDQNKRLQLKVDNILNDSKESYYSFFDTKKFSYSKFNPGTSFSLSYSIKF